MAGKATILEGSIQEGNAQLFQGGKAVVIDTTSTFPSWIWKEQKQVWENLKPQKNKISGSHKHDKLSSFANNCSLCLE